MHGHGQLARSSSSTAPGTARGAGPRCRPSSTAGASPRGPIDLPGHGMSTEPLGDLPPTPSGGRARGDRERDGGDGVVLVGHSYGGGVITEAARGRWPRACRSPISSTSPRSPRTTASPSPARSANLPPRTRRSNGVLPAPRRRHVQRRLGRRRRRRLLRPLHAPSRPTAARRPAVPPADGQPRPAGDRQRRGTTAAHLRRVHRGPGDPPEPPADAWPSAAATVVELATDHSPFMSMPAETADIAAIARPMGRGA